MMIQGVRADTGSREGKWVGLIIMFILSFTVVAIPFHQAESHREVILDHQVLVTDVEQENLAMLAELRLAHEEIRDLRVDLDGEWPSVGFLKDQWVAPFVEDQSWKRKGAHTWLLDERGYYFSIPSELGFADSFILNANNVSPEIWIFFDGIANQPTQFDENTLKLAGWKRVVNESEIAEQHNISSH